MEGARATCCSRLLYKPCTRRRAYVRVPGIHTRPTPETPALCPLPLTPTAPHTHVRTPPQAYLSIDLLVSRGSLDIVRALTDAAVILDSLGPAGAKARKIKALQDKAAAAMAAQQGKQINRWAAARVGRAASRGRGSRGHQVVQCRIRLRRGAAWHGVKHVRPLAQVAPCQSPSFGARSNAPPPRPWPRRRLPDARRRDGRFNFATPPELAAIDVQLPVFPLPALPGPDAPLPKGPEVVKTVRVAHTSGARAWRRSAGHSGSLPCPSIA